MYMYLSIYAPEISNIIIILYEYNIIKAHEIRSKGVHIIIIIFHVVRFNGYIPL